MKTAYRLMLLLLLGSTFCAPIYGQSSKTKKVVESEGILQWKFHALRDKDETKHGNFLMEVMLESGTYTLEQGAYLKGKKSGQWELYHYGSQQLASTGWYIEDRKSGEWTYFHTNGSIKRQGAYKGGKEIGQWINYYPGMSHQGKEESAEESSKETQLVFSKGEFANGEKQGRWEYFDPNGQLMEAVDFSADTLLFTNTLENPFAIQHLLHKSDNSYEVVGEKIAYEKLNSPPIFPGGAVTLYKSLFPDLTYPGPTNTPSDLVIRATVNEDGSSVDYRIEFGLDQTTDLEVLRRLDALEDCWKPGFYKGKPVAAIVYFRIGFTKNLPEPRLDLMQVEARKAKETNKQENKPTQVLGLPEIKETEVLQRLPEADEPSRITAPQVDTGVLKKGPQ